MNFTHLHNHSHYSLLDGLPKIDDMIEKTKEFGLDSVALTDHGTMYGVIEFYQKCLKADIKPIIGVEAYVARNLHTDKRPRVDDKPYHLLLLAYNYEGYQNLMRLTSIAHLKGYYYKPRVDKELLKLHHNGLIASTACLGGEIQKSILNDNDLDKTVLKIKEYQDIFGKENFYLEVQHHPELPEQMKVNAAIFELGKNLNIPVIATCDSHYLNRDEQEAQDVMLCVQTGKTVNDSKRLNMTDFWAYMKSPDEMQNDFATRPEVLSNTYEIAGRCSVEIPLLGKHFPAFDVQSGKTPNKELTNLAFEKLKEKFGIDGELDPSQSRVGSAMSPNLPLATIDNEKDERLARVKYELEVITSKGYSTYFLIVSDFVNWMREKGIVTTTRGSAAGCFVSYLIGITNIDPIKYKIPFERFLNPFRPSLPDIDVDIADNRRDEVIKYVREKYGEDKVAQICTFGTMAARGSVKDTGRALDYAYSLCDELSKMIPMGKQGFLMTIERALKENSELKERYESDSQVKKLFDLAQKIEGCARHASVHAAGVVISPTSLTDYTPLQLDKDGTIITQYDMYSVGEDGVGLVKLDFLGIRNLSILGEAIRYIEAIHGDKIDISSIPLDDEKTFKLLASGRTMGVFQLSGDAMTQNLVALKPTTIHDIMAMIALYRPGPIDSIPEYIRRKHNPELITYPHEKLKKYLEESLGLLVYQDDLLYTAIELAGYNWNTVDKFRKAIGKKIPRLMLEQEKIFIEGCQKQTGLSLKEAESLWKLFDPFKGYGFNKAHAASYGMVAYQTAYLKAHYPAAYMAALMTAESRDLDKIADAITECGEMGIEVTLPDINVSFSTFTVAKESLSTKRPTIYFGLVAVKNIGGNIVENIITERKENGKFKSLENFLFRVKSKDLNKKSLESLIKSGALDCFDSRDQMLGNLDKLLNYIKEVHKNDASAQANLFAPIDRNNIPPLVLNRAPTIDKRQLLLWEKELLGLYVSEHPFFEFEKHLKDFIIPCNKLNNYKNNVDICIAGFVSAVKKIMTKNNEQMIFVTLEDNFGDVEVIVFPKLYKENPAIWQKDAALAVEGKVSVRDADAKMIANRVFELNLNAIDELKKKFLKNKENNFAREERSSYNSQKEHKLPSQLIINLTNLPDIELQKKLKILLTRCSGGSKVILKIGKGPNIKKIETGFLVSISDILIQEIEKLAGESSVEKL